MAEARITPRSQDYAQWYQDVIREAGLAEAAEVVRGCMVIKPHGYAIWEKMQADLDRRFKATGHQNCAFPLLIPLSFLAREAAAEVGLTIIDLAERMGAGAARATPAAAVAYLLDAMIESRDPRLEVHEPQLNLVP